MSTTTTRHGPQLDRAIARSADGRPALLAVTGIIGSHIIVENEVTGSSIGLHRDQVYRYDDEKYRNLVQAWESGATEALSDLWQTAAPYMEGR